MRPYGTAYACAATAATRRWGEVSCCASSRSVQATVLHRLPLLGSGHDRHSRSPEIIIIISIIIIIIVIVIPYNRQLIVLWVLADETAAGYR